MMFTHHANAEFTKEETKLLLFMQNDTRMEHRFISILGMGYGDARILSRDLLELLQQGEFSVLDEKLQKHNLKIDMSRSNTAKGNYEHEDYINSSLVLQKELNKTPRTKAEWELYDAVRANNKEKVRRILESNTVNTIDLNKYSNFDAFTPLTASSSQGYDDIIRILLEYDVNKDKEDKNDFHLTPLGHAINANHLTTVKLLVEAGADINLTTGFPSKRSPLEHAVISDNLEVLKYLLEKGANPNTNDENGSNILISALWRSKNEYNPNQVAIISLLIEKSNINHHAKPYINSKGKKQPRTALIVAILNGHRDAIIDKLLEHGAKIGTDLDEQLELLRAFRIRRQNQYKKGEKGAFINSALKAAKLIGYSENKDIQKRLASTLGDAYEMSIILGRKLNKTDKVLFERLAKDNKNAAALFHMLAILEQAVSKQQTTELKEWSKQYSPNMLNWCFKYIKDYAETLPMEAKKRLLDCVKVFETKKC